MVHAQDQSDFISIDCGITPGSEYPDKETGIHYVSDTGFIEGGVNREILPSYKSNYDFQLNTLKSFPEGIRNCYTLRPRKGKGNRYLIRARFGYGRFDFKGQPPLFDLYLGSDYWDRVNFTFSFFVGGQIIHLASSDYIHVCLVNIGLGIPLISTLELWLLDSNMYANQVPSLMLANRINYGTTQKLRYPSDKYDRIWYPTDSSQLTNVQTSGTVYSGSSSTENVSLVMSTAVKAVEPTDYISVSWNDTEATEEFFFYIHFAKVETLKKTNKRDG